MTLLSSFSSPNSSFVHVVGFFLNFEADNLDQGELKWHILIDSPCKMPEMGGHCLGTSCVTNCQLDSIAVV